MKHRESENNKILEQNYENHKRLLDAESAAHYLSISRAKLYQLLESGKVPSVRIDTRRLFDIHELNEFVDRLKTSQRSSKEKAPR